MNNLKVGLGRVNINPPMGIDITGYYIKRYADGILDDLEINALAFQSGDITSLLISIDHCEITLKLVNKYLKQVSAETGIPVEHIIITQTHTHTGPTLEVEAAQAYVNDSSDVQKKSDQLIKEYAEFVGHRLVDASNFAIEDLKPAKMGYGIGKAPNVAFVRRFEMKDGSIMTNPGVNNPEILRPIGEVDERVNVLRFDREDAPTIVLANFGNHPDVIGGNKISADWPGLLRTKIEKILDNTKCVFFNGAQGDVNHVNVFPKDGDLNGIFMDFDDVSRGYAHAHHIANVVAGGILQSFEKVKYVDVDKISATHKPIKVPSNRPKPEELPEAHRINDLHNAGKDSELPYEGMMLTTVVAEAARMVCLENGPDSYDMSLSALVIGPVALIGIPGEPFTGIGVQLKETEGYDLVLPMCLANGAEGYFPMQDAYDEGGYESRSSRFKAGVAEYIIKEGKELLVELRK